MNKPFLGAAYYPEDWDESQIPYDIEMMKKAGIKCARIGEFAWRKMEPKQGEYHFEWLHKVVDSLREAEIDVIIGTPSATPPIWFAKAHPDALLWVENGTQLSHGGRRHMCSNHPAYIEESLKIAEKLGQEFGNDPAVIGWQIDNEIYHEGDVSCVCPYCVKRFHDRLRKEYGTVEEVNRRWNLNLFSQAYDDIDDIPVPVHAWHNPHIQYEWVMAHEEADVAFINMQAEVLKKYTKAPIGTDMMPILGLDYEAMNEKLDVIQFNHYNTEDDLDKPIMWFDMLRTFKDHPFWNTETAPQWAGSTTPAWPMQAEGYSKVNSWLPIALGGEANMYWLWRQHWAGHELMHGHVLSPEGRPSHVFNEIVETAAGLDKASSFLSETKPAPEVAMHFTSHAWKLYMYQNIFNGHSYENDMMKLNAAIHRLGTDCDVISGKHGLDEYKVVISSELLTLEDGDLCERIKKFVNNGGIWVAGPLTDVRNTIGAHYTDKAMGMIEEFTGVRLDYSIFNNGKYLRAKYENGDNAALGEWVECFTIPDNAKAIATITSGHSSLIGKVVSAEIPVGKGKVILMGSNGAPDMLKRILSIAFKEAGVKTYETTGNLTVVPRKGKEKEGLILVEIRNQPSTIVLDGKMTDVLTGRTLEGTVEVGPFEVICLIKQKAKSKKQ